MTRFEEFLNDPDNIQKKILPLQHLKRKLDYLGYAYPPSLRASFGPHDLFKRRALKKARDDLDRLGIPLPAELIEALPEKFDIEDVKQEVKQATGSDLMERLKAVPFPSNPEPLIERLKKLKKEISELPPDEMKSLDTELSPKIKADDLSNQKKKLKKTVKEVKEEVPPSMGMYEGIFEKIKNMWKNKPEEKEESDDF